GKGRLALSGRFALVTSAQRSWDMFQALLQRMNVLPQPSCMSSLVRVHAEARPIRCHLYSFAAASSRAQSQL
ncbi:MAG: hypothetical protein ABGY41_21440, partial [Candidatus Poribacteria bacterium]